MKKKDGKNEYKYSEAIIKEMVTCMVCVAAYDNCYINKKYNVHFSFVSCVSFFFISYLVITLNFVGVIFERAEI